MKNDLSHSKNSTNRHFFRIRLFSRLLMGLFCCYILVGCQEEESQVIYRNKKLIDSLQQSEKERLGPELDSLCLVHHDSLLNSYVDSIMTSRIKSISKILKDE